MKVVWVNKRDWKTPGPIVNVAVQNAASFAAAGFDTHLCIGAGDPSDTAEDLAAFYGVENVGRFRVHRIPRFRMGGGTYSLSIFHHAFNLIRQLSRQHRVAVFTRESGFLAPLVWLCRNRRVRGFYELHDFYADLSWVERPKSGHYREWLYEHLFLPRIDGLVCITAAQKSRYGTVFPKTPSVAFPLGTRIRANAMGIEARRRRRTVMYVGHMHEEKGIDFLLQAAVRFKAHGIRLVFWGGKPHKVPYFRKKATDLGLSDTVVFEPFQPPEKMHTAMSDTASVGAVMLQDTYYNRYLTCPVKALDYLSHGIPAVGSDLPSVREVLGDAGIYVPSADADGFVTAVVRLLEDPAHYAAVCGAVRSRAREITWEKRAEALSVFAASRFREEP